VDKVHTPNVVWVLRPESDNRTILVIETTAFLVALGLLQALLTPQPLNLLIVYVPALDPEQLCDLAITVAAVLLGQPDQCQAQGLIITFVSCLISLRRARHADRSARASFRGIEPLAHMDHGLTQDGRCQAFGFR